MHWLAKLMAHLEFSDTFFRKTNISSCNIKGAALQTVELLYTYLGSSVVKISQHSVWLTWVQVMLIEWSSEKKDVTNNVLESLLSTIVKKCRYINEDSVLIWIVFQCNQIRGIQWNWWKFEYNQLLKKNTQITCWLLIN